MQNDLTGEHSCVMLKELNSDEASDQGQWLAAFWTGETMQPGSSKEPQWFEHVAFPSDFRRRFLSLLSYQFSSFHPSLALTILQNKKAKETQGKSLTCSPGRFSLLRTNFSWSLTLTALSSSELAALFSPYDLKRLELYSRSMVDYHLIMDLVPLVARIFFLKQLGDVSLSAAQCVSLCLVTLQFCYEVLKPEMCESSTVTHVAKTTILYWWIISISSDFIMDVDEKTFPECSQGFRGLNSCHVFWLFIFISRRCCWASAYSTSLWNS